MEPEGTMKISANIWKINDLRKASPGNQQVRDGRFPVGLIAIHGARCPVAADVSRRILDDDAALVGRPQRASADTVCATAPGPPTYVGGYERAWPRLDAGPSRFLSPFDTSIIDHGDDFTTVPENQKTYRRLFGMIFFKGSESMVVTAPQWLAAQKISKNRQNTKANSFFVA
jgi:hypothetical protein